MIELHPPTPPAGPPSLTAGPIDERDAFWCWSHTTAVLFDDHGDAVTTYLRTMIDSYDAESRRAGIDSIAQYDAAARRDSYRDALRVIELASDAADRMTARYDDERRASEVLR